EELVLVLGEVLRALLDGAGLLDAEARPDGELVLVLAKDVLDAAVARLFEKLQGAVADASNEEEALLVGERLGLRRRGVDSLLPEALHRRLGALLQLGGRFDRADSGDRRELFGAGLGDLFERAVTEAVHRAGDGVVDFADEGESGDRLLL